MTTAIVALVHAVAGPDHYIPFIALAKARNWPLSKTLWVTFGCGAGHVLGSIVLGLGGIALGVSLGKLTGIESARGNVAAWLLIGFGLVYFLWSMGNLRRGKVHSHHHYHRDGSLHEHEHAHTHEHVHVHDEKAARHNVTPWVLFIVFLLGPCEPLIPLMLAPAVEGNYAAVWAVASLFAIITLAVMVGMVTAGYYGLRGLSFKLLEQYAHPAAGMAIMISGLLAIQLG